MHFVDTETRHGAGSYLRNLENRIRERAYEIWTAHGCIHGQADQHWVAAEREILTESTATLAGVQQKRRFRARSKKSDWPRELRIKFFGMLFGVGIAAVGAAAFSLGAHHNGNAPASSEPTREPAARASAAKVGAEVTASKRVEATTVDTDRASTASDVTSGDKSNVATACEASGAACGNDASVPGKPRVTRLRAANERPAIAAVLVGRGDAPNGTWTNVSETPVPAISPRPALEHTKPVASQRSAVAADRPDTKLGRPYAGDGSSGHNGFWAWSR
jgi:hypothetical protein